MLHYSALLGVNPRIALLVLGEFWVHEVVRVLLVADVLHDAATKRRLLSIGYMLYMYGGADRVFLKGRVHNLIRPYRPPRKRGGSRGIQLWAQC